VDEPDNVSTNNKSGIKSLYPDLIPFIFKTDKKKKVLL